MGILLYVKHLAVLHLRTLILAGSVKFKNVQYFPHSPLSRFANVIHTESSRY